MPNHQNDFITFALEQGVLKFGQFQLKSGRTSPYFFNAGLFQTGRALARLGQFYAKAIVDSGIQFDLLFGPAYKGIPLASSTAIALAEQHGRDLPYCFNRKEKKEHGEGGQIVGAPLKGRVLIIDDVITAGTAIRESLGLIEAAGAELAGIVVALDRQERGPDERSAIQTLQQHYQVPVVAIADLQALLAYLNQSPELESHRQAVQAYRAQYGISP